MVVGSTSKRKLPLRVCGQINCATFHAGIIQLASGNLVPVRIPYNSRPSTFFGTPHLRMRGTASHVAPVRQQMTARADIKWSHVEWELAQRRIMDLPPLVCCCHCFWTRGHLEVRVTNFKQNQNGAMMKEKTEVTRWHRFANIGLLTTSSELSEVDEHVVVLQPGCRVDFISSASGRSQAGT